MLKQIYIYMVKTLSKTRTEILFNMDSYNVPYIAKLQYGLLSFTSLQLRSQRQSSQVPKIPRHSSKIAKLKSMNYPNRLVSRSTQFEFHIYKTDGDVFPDI